jgi:hypothetical protein
VTGSRQGFPAGPISAIAARRARFRTRPIWDSGPVVGHSPRHARHQGLRLLRRTRGPRPRPMRTLVVAYLVERTTAHRSSAEIRDVLGHCRVHLLQRLRLGPPRWWSVWWVTWRWGEGRLVGLR